MHYLMLKEEMKEWYDEWAKEIEIPLEKEIPFPNKSVLPLNNKESDKEEINVYNCC